MPVGGVSGGAHLFPWFQLCRVSVESLSLPAICDVSGTLRSGLGIVCDWPHKWWVVLI